MFARWGINAVSVYCFGQTSLNWLVLEGRLSIPWRKLNFLHVPKSDFASDGEKDLSYYQTW
jgi:hypothetical protein